MPTKEEFVKIFGFSGASRTGKTTLAKLVADRMKIHYHDASVTKIMREFGIDPVSDVPLFQRLEAQELLLTKFMDAIKAAPRPAVCDRTPLDMIGYMLGEVTMHNLPVELHDRVQSYVDRCITETERHFDMVVAVRPLPHYKADPTKPPPNRAYQSAVQFLIEGACMNTDNLHSACMTFTDLEERADAACTMFAERVEDLLAEKAQNSVH
jgi:predicted ATPase